MEEYGSSDGSLGLELNVTEKKGKSNLPPKMLSDLECSLENCGC